MPSATRMGGVISPRWIEYWKNSRPAIASALSRIASASISRTLRAVSRDNDTLSLGIRHQITFGGGPGKRPSERIATRARTRSPVASSIATNRSLVICKFTGVTFPSPALYAAMLALQLAIFGGFLRVLRRLPEPYGLNTLMVTLGLALLLPGVILLLIGEGGMGIVELPGIMSKVMSYTRLAAIGMSKLCGAESR